MANEIVYLVDGSGYIFRAFYAVAPLTTKKGFPTNALYGFSRMLLKLMQKAGGEHTVVVFDAGRETFRSKLFEGYKANRQECPSDLAVQMPYFRKISRALGLPTLELPGYEADDLIGTLAARLKKEEYSVIIVSGDKDLLQLVNDRVRVWDPMKDKEYSEPEVVEKFGVPPSLVSEYLGLVGDSSDNIPGLEGVGPKTATQLLSKYGSLDNLFQQIDALKNDAEIKGRLKIAERLEAQKEIVLLSKKLATIVEDAPVGLEVHGETKDLASLSSEDLLEAISQKGGDTEVLSSLSEELEFSSLFAEVPKIKKLTGSQKEIYQTIFSGDFETWSKTFLSQREFSFDLETTSLDPLEAEIVGIAISWSTQGSEEPQAYYIPVGHVDEQGVRVPDQLTVHDFLSVCKDFLESTEIRKVGQNLKYDTNVLAKYGVILQGISFDTMVAAYLLNPDQRAFNLDALSETYLGRTTLKYQEVTGSLRSFALVPIPQASRYACEDAHYARMLKEQLEPLLEKEGLAKVFHDIEVPLVSVLAEIERTGVTLDLELLAAQRKELLEKLEVLGREIREVAGVDFNFNSPKQLSDVLFGKLGISTKGLKKTKTGISTDSSVLEKLEHLHPLPGLILRYRMLAKLEGTYLAALPEAVSARTGRLHTKLNQTVTGTGRLSSSEPNLQNIPISSEEGRKIRNGFIASPGKVMISADYSQVELRILAHLSNDATLIQAFTEDIDIHEITAREILNIPPEKSVSSSERRIGKTLNFGIIYGMGPYRLAADLGISASTADQYIRSYFSRYQGVSRFFKELERQAEESKVVSTLFGRRRYLSQVDTSGRDKGFLLRAALNAPVQGTAADLIKLAMVHIAKRIHEENLPLVLLLQIHDELLFEAEESRIEEMSQLIKSVMEGVFSLRVPLKVEVGRGRSWGEAH